MALVKLYDKGGQEFEFETVLKKVVIEVPDVKKKKVETVLYIPVEKDTTKYNVREKNTVNYKVIERDCIKWNTINKTCEKPILKEKVYEIPNVESVKTIKESAGLIKDVLMVIPGLIVQLKLIIDTAKAIPQVISRFQEMRDMIKDYKVPDFQHIEVIVPKFKDETVARPVFKDVEVLKPVFRDKPMTVEEYRRAYEQGDGK